MRSVIILFCLLFAVRALADNHTYFEGHLPAKMSVGKEKITSNILLAVKGELFEITIIPEGEEENSGRDTAEEKEAKDTTVISALVKHDLKIFDAEGKQQIGQGKRIGEGDHFQLEFAHFYKGMKFGDVNLGLLFNESHEDGGGGVDVNLKLTSSLGFTLVTKGRLAFDMEKTMRCRWGGGSDSDC